MDEPQQLVLVRCTPLVFQALKSQADERGVSIEDQALEQLKIAVDPDRDEDATCVITVRCKRSLHSALSAIAHDSRRSLNREVVEALKNHVTRVGVPES